MVIVLISAVLVGWSARWVYDLYPRPECGHRLGMLRCEAPAGHEGRHYDGEAGVFWPGREDVQR